MKAETILRSKGSGVVTISMTDRIADAIELLNKHNIGALVVSGPDGQVTGILSERDIIRRLTGDSTALMFRTVAECMTRDPYTCSPDTGIEELMQMMTNKRIRHMPVIDGKKLVGVVSIGDVVKRKIEVTEEEAAALRDYIAS